MSANYGQWQAQGDDIKTPPKGHCRPWGQDTVPTKAEGLAWLAEVALCCTDGQRRLRAKKACPQARRFIKRAPPGGYPTISKPFYAEGKHDNRRIDVEIWGHAFGGTEFNDNGC